MRLVTFANKSGAERLGALFDGDSRVADLAEAHRMRTGKIAPQLSSMQAVIEAGPQRSILRMPHSSTRVPAAMECCHLAMFA